MVKTKRRQLSKAFYLRKVKQLANKYKVVYRRIKSDDGYWLRRFEQLAGLRWQIYQYGKDYRWKIEYEQIKKSVGIVD